MNNHGNATKLQITFEDGVTLGAEGIDATVIWSWLSSCEAMALLGAGPANEYEGPFLTEVRRTKR